MGLIADVIHYNACAKTLSNDKQGENEGLRRVTHENRECLRATNGAPERGRQQFKNSDDL